MWILEPQTKELVYKDDEGGTKHRVAVFGSGFLLLDANAVEDYDIDLTTLFNRNNLPPIRDE